jgi:hypothetical protein
MCRPPQLVVRPRPLSQHRRGPWSVGDRYAAIRKGKVVCFEQPWPVRRVSLFHPRNGIRASVHTTSSTRRRALYVEIETGRDRCQHQRIFLGPGALARNAGRRESLAACQKRNICGREKGCYSDPSVRLRRRRGLTREREPLLRSLIRSPQ